MDYSNCLPYSCITFALFKNTVTFPCILHRRLWMQKKTHPYVLPSASPSSASILPHILALAQTRRSDNFPTSQVNSFHFSTILQNSPLLPMSAAPPNITLLCLRGLCTDLINFPWNDSHKQHFKHQIYLKAKWSGEHSTTRARGTCFSLLALPLTGY